MNFQHLTSNQNQYCNLTLCQAQSQTQSSNFGQKASPAIYNSGNFFAQIIIQSTYINPATGLLTEVP